MSKDDSLIRQPMSEGFKTESPLRAFSDFTVKGRYAVGRGFRPALQHLTAYLDAIETQEHWQLVQLFPDAQGKPSAAIFRSVPARRFFPVDTDKEKLADLIQGRSLGEVYDKIASGLGISPDKLLEDAPEQSDDACPVCNGLNTSCPQGCVEPVDDPVNPIPYMETEVDRVARELHQAGEKDDPVNPKHYNGTECAEIGELLTANAYQTLKYCWRLGEKDDPVIELGKAIWYWKREIDLRGEYSTPSHRQEIPEGFDFEIKIMQRSDFAKNIARMLWEIHCYGGTIKHRRAILEALEEQLSPLKDRGNDADT